MQAQITEEKITEEKIHFDLKTEVLLRLQKANFLSIEIIKQIRQLNSIQLSYLYEDALEFQCPKDLHDWLIDSLEFEFLEDLTFCFDNE